MADSTAIHSSFDSLEARMAAFKAKAAPQVITVEESKQQQQQQPAPIDDPYDAFITPIRASNIVPAHSPMRQHSPSLEAQAAALLDVPALPLDMSSPSRPDHSSSGDPETPPPELPPSAKRGSVTLSNISTSSSADSPHAVDHVELSSSPPVGLVLQYTSDGESGSVSSRRSAALRVPPRSGHKGRTHSTDNAQSWAEAEQIQKAHAIEKELAATRRRQQQQEQERRAREAFATPPRSAPPASASASASAAGISPLSARSRGAGGLGSESARGNSTGDGASAAAVLNALKRKQEQARRGGAASGSGSQTSRAGPSSSPYAAASSSAASASASQQPLTARGILTARGGRAQGAYDSYAGAAADYEEDDDDGIAGSTTARGGSASLPQQQRRADAASSSSNSRGSASASSSSLSLADQRKREIAERKERLRIRKANALNAITIASTPVEEGGTLQTARGPAAPSRREGQPQANGTTKGGPETRRPNEGRNCELDPGCVVM